MYFSFFFKKSIILIRPIIFQEIQDKIFNYQEDDVKTNLDISILLIPSLVKVIRLRRDSYNGQCNDLHHRRARSLYIARCAPKQEGRQKQNAHVWAGEIPGNIPGHARVFSLLFERPAGIIQ